MSYLKWLHQENKRARQLDDALLIQRLLGVRPAAEYLKQLGWTFQQAKWSLLRR